MRFRDRVDAGRHLAEVVQRAEVGDGDVVVLGLPRGGVPVAFEVAQALGAPLDVIVVRKLGVPFQPELAMGAIGEEGVRVVNEEVLRSSGLDIVDVDAVERRERVELERRAGQYRGDRPRLDLRDRCAVIVDDGIATGSTARAACQVARAARRRPRRPGGPGRVAPCGARTEGRLRRSAVCRCPRALLRRGGVVQGLRTDDGRAGRGAPPARGRP